jgi:hypothetical protein
MDKSSTYSNTHVNSRSPPKAMAYPFREPRSSHHVLQCEKGRSTVGTPTSKQSRLGSERLQKLLEYSLITILQHNTCAFGLAFTRLRAIIHSSAILELACFTSQSISRYSADSTLPRPHENYLCRDYSYHQQSTTSSTLRCVGYKGAY